MVGETMANNSADDRKKRVEKYRDTDNLITEKKDERNIFEEKVFDVLEYIEKEAKSANNSIARKILKLKEYGITDKEIITRYDDKAGNIENENSAASILESVFFDLVNYINNIPNGVFIDFATAKKNNEKSFEQAIKYGIFPEDSLVESLDKTLFDTLKEIGLITDKPDSDIVNYIIENFNQEYISYKEIDNDINEFLNKDENDMNLSDAEKNISRKNKQIIANSPYKTDMELFRISKLQVLLRTTEGSAERERISEQISNFYKENPTYIAKKLPVLNDDGSLNVEEIKKMNEYREAYQKTIILRHFDQFNDMTEQELAELPEKEKNHIFMCAFSALKYKKDSREDERELANGAMRIIKQLAPELDLNNEEKLAKFFEKITGRTMNLEALSLAGIIEIYSRQLRSATDKYIEDNKDSLVDKEIDLSDLDLDSSRRKVFDSTMKNYFVGSKIKFTKNDEELYNMMHQEFTVNSWIENKDDAIRLRYKALLDMREEYKEMPTSEYIARKLHKIEDDIKKIEKEFGKVDIKPKEGELAFDLYKQYFINAGLTKYLTRDAMEWQEGADYDNLDATHKKGYIRNILVALEHDDNSNFCITKLALRRLELMNSNGKQFITFDENGGYKINEELILQEYNKMSEYTYRDFDELTKSAELRKNEYLLTKLEEYSHLRDKDFVELEDKSNKAKSIKQIEKARYLSRQKSIHKMVNVPETKDKKITDSDMFSAFENGRMTEETLHTNDAKKYNRYK